MKLRHLDFEGRDYPLHFWLMQFIGFSYLVVRLTSRDYSIYGLMAPEFFDYSRMIMSIYPPKLSIELVNFHWIYSFMDRPGELVLLRIQQTALFFGTAGLFGIFPRLAAGLSFCLYLHLLGFMQASNSEIDGSTLCLITLLIMAVSPGRSFYTLGRGRNGFSKRVERWPIYVLFLFVSAFYVAAGLNKVLDIGPHWAMDLHLERWAIVANERAVFISNQIFFNELFPIVRSEAFSIVSGWITLIGELGFFAILFFPRARFSLVSSMIGLHLVVCLTMGINFIGSSLILLLCFDWNAIARKGKVYFDGDCGLCSASVRTIQRLDVLKNLEFIPIAKIADGHLGLEKARLINEMGMVDEDGELLYGALAFERVFERIPVLWPIALLYKIPFMVYVAEGCYRIVARNRYRLGFGGKCSMREPV